MIKILSLLCGILTVTMNLSACTRHQVIHANPEPTQRASRSLAGSERLSVAVVVLKPNGRDDNGPAPGAPSAPSTIRRAEARFIAHQIKTTLDATGYWKPVAVTPSETKAMDVVVRGWISESNGLDLLLGIEARDAAGRNWLRKEYPGTASKYAYGENSAPQTDPFQNVYNAIANDLAAARNRLGPGGVQRLKSISELRYGQALLPGAFEGYLERDATGEYQLNRLPARADPALARVRQIRGRDRAFLGVLDEHYGAFADAMREPYQGWRKSSHEEMMALRKTKRSARNRVALGTAAAVVGVAGVAAGDGALGTATGLASTVVGARTLSQGLAKYREADLHREFLAELDASFAREIAPRVVGVEGRLRTLNGTAASQYRQWQRLLREIYEAETGFSELAAMPEKTIQ